MTDILQPHERLDDLVLDGMKLIQRDDQFCFSIDTVLLAHFGPVLRGPALDLGTGTAAIPLILTARGATDVTGVELNPVMADIARRNAALNGRDDRIRIVEGDYRRIKEWSPSGYYSVVYANPPYREKSRGAYSETDGIRRARHEETATLDDVMEAVKYALKYRGRFRMVHITERQGQALSRRRRPRRQRRLRNMAAPHRPRSRRLVQPGRIGYVRKGIGERRYDG